MQRIIETQPAELLNLAANYFRQCHQSMPVVERQWDPRIGDYVLHARRIFAIEGRMRGSVVTLVSPGLARAAEEGRLYLSAKVLRIASMRRPILPTHKPAQPRVVVVPRAPRRRPYALATRARVLH